MILPALVALVLADQATTALIGDRIFPVVLPENASKPAITWRNVSAVDTHTLDGTRYRQIRFQVDCWGDTMADAAAVAAALDQLLDGYSGNPTRVEIANVWRDGEHGDYDSTERAFYVQTDWMILFTEQ